MPDAAKGLVGVTDDRFIRKMAAFSLLEKACDQLEWTHTQDESARQQYGAIGNWLGSSALPLLTCTRIYPQGSVAHGTTVRPIGKNEYDVDLIAFLTGATKWTSPAFVKQIIGDRLRANGLYRDKLEEMPRCWRINYANNFHLDITPSIRNPDCPNGGELVPDKNLGEWKPSNPQGFCDRFAARALLRPVRPLAKRSALAAAADAEIVPFPTKATVRGVLRRAVQLLKRHRDIDFQTLDTSLAPLSIIITTLASKAYEYCVTSFVYENDFDLLLDTVRYMPHFIERRVIFGELHYFIWNETTQGENFAEKWNKERSRADQFYRWHSVALHEFTRLLEFEGLDAMASELGGYLGNDLARATVKELTDTVSFARRSGTLVAGASGLAAASATTARAAPVLANTFYGN